MKRSDEIAALANRFSARVASNLFPGHPEIAQDMERAVPFLHELAEAERAKEHAGLGNGKGPEKPAAPAKPDLAG